MTKSGEMPWMRIRKPPQRMFERSKFEDDVHVLVARIVELGIEENQENLNLERVALLKERTFASLDELEGLIRTNPIVVTRVRALLAHHYFNLIRTGVFDTTRLRLKALDEMIEAFQFPLHQIIQTKHSKEEDHFQTSKPRENLLYSEQRPEKKMFHAIPMPSQIFQKNHCHESRSTPTTLHELALKVIVARRELRTKSRLFANWRIFLGKMKQAGYRIWEALRRRQTKSLTRAFGKLSRYSVHKCAIHIAAREMYAIRHEIPQQRRPQRSRTSGPPSIKGRKLPWES